MFDTITSRSFLDWNGTARKEFCKVRSAYLILGGLICFQGYLLTSSEVGFEERVDDLVAGAQHHIPLVGHVASGQPHDVDFQLLVVLFEGKRLLGDLELVDASAHVGLRLHELADLQPSECCLF